MRVARIAVVAEAVKLGQCLGQLVALDGDGALAGDAEVRQAQRLAGLPLDVGVEPRHVALRGRRDADVRGQRVAQRQEQLVARSAADTPHRDDAGAGHHRRGLGRVGRGQRLARFRRHQILARPYAGDGEQPFRKLHPLDLHRAAGGQQLVNVEHLVDQRLYLLLDGARQGGEAHGDVLDGDLHEALVQRHAHVGAERHAHPPVQLARDARLASLDACLQVAHGRRAARLRPQQRGEVGVGHPQQESRVVDLLLDARFDHGRLGNFFLRRRGGGRAQRGETGDIDAGDGGHVEAEGTAGQDDGHQEQPNELDHGVSLSVRIRPGAGEGIARPGARPPSLRMHGRPKSGLTVVGVGIRGCYPALLRCVNT
ncbi:MAG: hypothetical protein FJ318_06235 [SAR202 cluster bacterium]|nr:hypothetical protein [SAR202 cluster bacterium]